MEQWQIMLFVFSGFVVVLVVCVALIAVNILSAHAARRHLREIRRAPLRPDSQQPDITGRPVRDPARSS
jgi:mannose/fructose/N-acetylgalactosamine-specific phosphotransferase system component IIC